MKTWKKPVLQKVSSEQLGQMIKAAACSVGFACYGYFR